MSTFADIKMYGRFVLGLPGFLRRRITLDEARDAVRRGLEARDDNFLKVMRRGVFGNPRSPYLPLLRAAQCEYPDIESSVRNQGLEATLEMLRAAGVYFSFEEYKGLQPVVRDGEVVVRDMLYLSSSFDHRLLDGASAARFTTALKELLETPEALMLEMI